MGNLEFDAISQSDLDALRLGQQSKLIAKKFVLAFFKARAGWPRHRAIGGKGLQPGIERYMLRLVCRDNLRLHKQAGFKSGTLLAERLLILAVHKDEGTRLKFGE